MRILIADDDPNARSLLVSVLTRDGHEVVETKTGAEAWAVLEKPDAPRLVVLDWMMPEMDGLEVLGRVRSQETEHPPYVIMLTAKDRKQDIVAALDAGANDYLAKPFNLAELRARIEAGRRVVEMQAALIESKRKLEHLATHDPLTGLLNRRAILEALSAELSRASRLGHEVAVGMCDLDHFKEINDRHGHQTGDDVLREVSRVLSASVREYDLVGRLGGEEFLVVMPIEATTDPAAVFDRLRRQVASSSISIRSGRFSVTISIGVVAVRGGTPVDDILTQADAALYEAKRQGRDRVVFRPRGAGVEERTLPKAE